MNNLCFNRFTLRTDDAKTRRKILRWLALNYRLYECLPSEAEIRGRFISRKPFPAEAFRRQIGKLHGDRTLLLRIVSTDLYSLYVEGNVYLLGAWYRIFLLPAPQRAGGVISISWHTNHPFLSRISGISARPGSTAFRLFSPCIASIPKAFPPILIRAR